MHRENKDEIYYQASVSLLNKLLKVGLITQEEYNDIDALNVQKWKPFLASI